VYFEPATRKENTQVARSGGEFDWECFAGNGEEEEMALLFPILQQVTSNCWKEVC